MVGLLNVPVPDVVQSKLELFVAEDPLNVYRDPSQIVAFGPAEAVADFEIVNVIELTAFPHGGLPVADSVNVTLPAAISAALGV